MKQRFQQISALCSSSSLTSNLILVSSRPPLYQQHDVAYEYESGALFRWLTRMNVNPCILAFTQEGQLHAFLSAYDPVKWLWEGPQLDYEHTQDIPADYFYTLKQFDDWLEKAIKDHTTLIMDPDDALLCLKVKQATRYRKPMIQKIDLDAITQPLRSQKDAWEIAQIQQAVAISIQSHIELMRHAHRDPHETAMHGRFLSTGYQSGINTLAYPPIIASGAHAATLHYHQNNCIPQPADWLLVDAGWRVNGYCSDISRSYPIRKQSHGIQREIYQLVLRTQQAAMQCMGPGMHWGSLNEQIDTMLTSGLVDLGILNATTHTHLKRYYPHRAGHWLGLEVHDRNPYHTDKKTPIPWSAGMVLTLEPGLYFPRDDLHVPLALRGFGVRIEDNILITATGYQNLSQALPVELDDIAAI